MLHQLLHIRHLSHTPRRFKPKNELKSLGAKLQKGSVSAAPLPRPATPLETTRPQNSLVLDRVVHENYNELMDNYWKLVFMTKEDIDIQVALDQGRQFGSYPSEHFLDRKKIIRELPDEIDILKTPQEEIDRVYSDVRKLDRDRAMHDKCMKYHGIDHNDFILKLRMGNNLEAYNKAERRTETFKHPSGLERIFQHLYAYNVEGFDRSTFGMPLLSGKHVLDKNLEPWPKELIEDLRPFDTEVKIHKKDTNFMDEDVLMSDTIAPLQSEPLSVEEALSNKGKPILVKRAEDYRIIEPPPAAVEAVVEKEALLLRDNLYDDINRKMKSEGQAHLIIPHQKFRPSEYVVVNEFRAADSHILVYNTRYFSLLPVYGRALVTLKHVKALYKHLVRVLFINADLPIDLLNRLNYRLPLETQTFMRKLHGKIHTIIQHRIMPVVTRHKVGDFRSSDAVLHKANMAVAFLRLTWIRRPRFSLRERRYERNGRSRRTCRAFNIAIVDPPRHY